MLPRPGAILRRPAPIPHQARVTAAVGAIEAAVVVATEEVAAAAAVVAEEVHVAGVLLRIPGTKFISQWRARSGLPGGLSPFEWAISICILSPDSVGKKFSSRFFPSRPSSPYGLLQGHMHSPGHRTQLLLPQSVK